MRRRIAAACIALFMDAINHAHAENFLLSSPTFNPMTTLAQPHVFNGFGCSGGNRSPALSWQHAPEGTKSFAITMYDPDAPTGSGWWHWVVYNIPASAHSLPEDAGNAEGKGLPEGAAQGRTDFGSIGYGGACPPTGSPAHRYVMTVHALKVDKLSVSADASAAMIGFMINMNRLGSATLQTTYAR